MEGKEISTEKDPKKDPKDSLNLPIKKDTTNYLLKIFHILTTQMRI